MATRREDEGRRTSADSVLSGLREMAVEVDARLDDAAARAVQLAARSATGATLGRDASGRALVTELDLLRLTPAPAVRPGGPARPRPVAGGGAGVAGRRHDAGRPGFSPRAGRPLASWAVPVTRPPASRP